jgi:hypothetical protein
MSNGMKQLQTLGNLKPERVCKHNLLRIDKHEVIMTYTRKYIFTEIDDTRCFADATPSNMKDSIKNIRMPIVHPYPAPMQVVKNRKLRS